MSEKIKMLEKEIECSFCNKTRHQVEQMIEGPQFGERTIYICNECVDVTYSLLNKSDEVKKKKEKIFTPEQIKEYLDEYVVGQEDAKISISVAVYNHYKRISKKSKEDVEKSNLLIIGQSGSGKTLTVKTIAKLFNLPYIIADATTITEAGYVGEDAENLIKRLIKSAGDDVALAQKGIIFVDEIDKKRRTSESATVSRDVSGEGVQQALLKMIEGTVIEVEDESGDTVDFDTTDILFIFSGAFVGLDEIIRKNRSKTSIGIGAELVKKSTFSSIAKSVEPSDLIKFGLIPEFVGRCPVVVVFDDLDSEYLLKILKEPKNSIVNQFKTMFKYDGVILEFDDKYLLNIAERCIKQNVGARGLRSILENDLKMIQYSLPRLAKEGLSKVVIDAQGTIKQIFKKKRANNDKV